LFIFCNKKNDILKKIFFSKKMVSSLRLIIINYSIYLLKSRFLTIASNFSLTSALSIFIYFISILSGKSNKISSKRVVKIVCKRRAPIFSTSSLT